MRCPGEPAWQTTMMLQRGDHVPHFHVKTVGGSELSYSTIWQRQNLLLVTIGDAQSTYAADLLARSAEFLAHNSVCVVTRDDVAGLPAPALLIADRWGEIVHVVCAPRVEDL